MRAFLRNKAVVKKFFLFPNSLCFVGSGTGDEKYRAWAWKNMSHKNRLSDMNAADQGDFEAKWGDYPR